MLNYLHFYLIATVLHSAVYYEHLACSGVDDLHFSISVDIRLSTHGRVDARQRRVGHMNRTIRGQRDSGRHPEGGRPRVGRARAWCGAGWWARALRPGIVA